MTGPSVSVLVPAYRAGAFLGRTLKSALEQTIDDHRVIVSIDDADPETVAAANTCTGDRRLTVTPQPRRLGHAGNINALLDRVETPYYTILPHDDVWSPRYLEALLHAARQHPEATLVYSDMRQFVGDEESVMSMRPLDGEPASRLGCYFGSIPLGLPLRGLSPGRVLEDGVRFPEGLPADRAADQVYIVDLLLRGTGIRVPEVLYTKHILAQSTSLSWRIRSEDDPGWRMASWTPAVAAQLRLIASAPLDEADRLAAQAACIGNALARRADTTGLPGQPGVEADMLQFMTLLSDELLRSVPPSPGAAGEMLRSPSFGAGLARMLTTQAWQARALEPNGVVEVLCEAAREADPDLPLALPLALPPTGRKPAPPAHDGRSSPWHRPVR